MKVLSIQSAVAYGHVGNSAAVFPLQRIGVEVVPVPTVNFSNHTGYGAWRGPLIPPSDVAEILLGVEERGGFVAPEMPDLLRDRVVPVADIITPNQFELGFLTGTEPADIASTLASADLARAMGPSTVLVT